MGELRRLEARLTGEQMDMLDGLAHDTGLTKTDVIRTLIRERSCNIHVDDHALFTCLIMH